MSPGDPALDIAQLVADHHQALYRYAYRLTGSQADAEDLTQQAFLVAHQRSDQVRQREHIRGWLTAIVRNCYLKTCRRREPLSAASIDLDINTVAAEPLPEAIDSAQLQSAINELDDDFKTVIVLFYFEFRSYRTIAALLDIPEGTVMSRLARAKAHLRRRLAQPAMATVLEAAHSPKGPRKSRLANNGPDERLTLVEQPTAPGQ
jgi:RNA polymerase sigma-70 factor, ECF subfamily